MDRRGRMLAVALAAALAGGSAAAASEGVSCQFVLAPPGAVYLYPDAPISTTFTGNNFGLEGYDTNFDRTPGPEPAVAGLATRNQTNADEVISGLGGSQLDNVYGLGYQAGPPEVPSVLAVPTGPSGDQIDVFVDSLLALPGVLTSTDTSIQGNATEGTVAAPQITHYTGDQLSVFGSGTISGAGIFIVDGDLSVLGTFDFAGLVIVRGTTRIGSTDVGGIVTIYGSLWTRGFEFWRGAALVQYSSQGLGLAEAAGAGGVCVPIGCGDGLVQAGEACDDGNLDDGDCCSSVCTLDPSGGACADDGNACTDDVCDGTGSCVHPPNTAPCDDGDACTTGDACSNGTCLGEPVVCGYCLACDPATGCPPLPVCRAPDRPARSRLVVSTRRGGRHLRFRWRGGRIPLADFGDPTRADGYEVCVTGDDPPASIWHGSAGAGFLCADGEPCWRRAKAGFRWRRKRAGAGLRSIRLWAGTGRKATIAVRASDGDGGLPPLPWPTPLTIQVRSANGTCWQSTFAGGDVTETDRRLVGHGSPAAPE